MDSINNHKEKQSSFTSIVSTSKPISGQDIIRIRMITGRTINSNTTVSTATQQSGSTSSSTSTATDAAIVLSAQNTTSALNVSSNVASTSQSLLTTANTEIAKTSKIKFLMLGDAGVGKTLILRRMQNINWPLTNDTSIYNATIGPDLHRLKCGNIEAIDIGGKKQYLPIAKKYCELFQIFIIVFDITNLDTFDCAKYWIEFIHSNKLIQTKRFLLIGNKNDLNSERKITKNLAKNLALTFNGEYLEISAKMDLTMDIIIDTLEKNSIQ